MNLIDKYNQTIISGFDKYHVPDLNLEKARIVFFLESPHKDEVRQKKPLCGYSGINFSEKLFEHSTPFGLWGNMPDCVGILESSPYPLQLNTYREFYYENEYPIDNLNADLVVGFQDLRDLTYNINEDENQELIKYACLLPKKIINTCLYKDYTFRIDSLLDVNIYIETIVLCGIFAQRFFNSYLVQKMIEIEKISTYGTKCNFGWIKIKDKNIHLIFINHPKEWNDEKNYNKFMKKTIDEIKEKINGQSIQ